MSRLVCLIILVGTAGCTGRQQFTASGPVAPATAPGRAEFAVSGVDTDAAPTATQTLADATDPELRKADESASQPGRLTEHRRDSFNTATAVQTVGHHREEPESADHKDALIAGELPQRVDSRLKDSHVIAASADGSVTADLLPAPSDLPTVDAAPALIAPSESPISMNLPTALSMIGGQHPAVGFAQWRVQEAYARLDQAEVLWLPSLQAGFSFHRHDGNYQASDGTIVDVNRNSFQYGLGSGATGAGTTPNPGIVARFHLVDAIFQPEIARTTAWARGHAAKGVMNEQLLNVAVAYLELLNAHQDARILQESRDRTEDLAKLTHDFAVTGQGLQADSDRLKTEQTLVESRLVSADERIDVASARLAQALSISAHRPIAPLDPTVVPIHLVAPDMDRFSLVTTGLTNRPELKESQALVAAACEQYRRQKYAPFVPGVLLGFSTGGFGGGLGNNLNNVDGRYDFDAMMTWEVRQLGFGERAARREAESRIQQARFEKIRVMDQVAREVTEAGAQVQHRAERIAVTQQAIESAQNSYKRNLSRIRDGQGLPLEVLQSVQALENARREYLRAVMDYNEAQFRLHWALGWPVTAPPESVSAAPVTVPPSDP